MSETKNIRIRTNTFKRLSGFAVGFETPDEVLTRVLDFAEVAKAAADPKFVAALEKAEAEDKKEGEKQK